MDIKKEAIKRVIETYGPEFLNDPVVAGSGVGQEVLDDEECRIIKELKPKPKKGRNTQRKSRPRGKR